MGKRKLTQLEVLERFCKAHGAMYDYSLVEYTTHTGKVEIICKQHGKFKQSASKHWLGQGCSDCRYIRLSKSKFSNIEEFSSKAIKVHGDKYSYNRAVYVDNCTNVEIVCNNHNTSFWQTPAQHLTGSGCTACASYGYSTDKPGYVYLLVCDDICKIGITNRNNDSRVKKISSSSNKDFKTHLKINFKDGSVARKIEKVVLRQLRGTYKQPTESFDGVTECFVGVDPEEIIKMIVIAASDILRKEY